MRNILTMVDMYAMQKGPSIVANGPFLLVNKEGVRKVYILRRLPFQASQPLSHPGFPV